MSDIVVSGKIKKNLSEKHIIHKVLRPEYKLYVGTECNDGRPIQQSWKYKQAVKKGIPIIHCEQSKPKIGGVLKDQPVSKELLVEKYAPKQLHDIIGHKTEIQQILQWLQSWDNGIPTFRSILITGPPGIGKTSVAHLIVKQLDYHIAEYNASDTRSVSLLKSIFVFNMKRLQKEVIIMDEVDGLSERGGVGEIASIISKTKIPIICIANERPPKLKPIINVCYDIKFSRPHRSTIATAISTIAKKENIEISKDEIEKLCEKNGNDIRSILNQLDFYESSEQKDADKDSVHRLDLFSATQKLMSQKKLSWDDASNLVFVDYHMVPLMVQEAYITSSRNSIEDIEYAADVLSMGDIINKRIYQTQDWSLLTHVVNTTVIVSKKVKGPAPFQIFPQMLGKTSKKNKHLRWMEEMGRRMRCSKEKMRLEYAEPLRTISTSGLLGNKPDIKSVIEKMDQLHLTRDDIFEVFEEVLRKPLDISTKIKTAFTREWNKTHSSENEIKKKKRGSGKEEEEEDEEENQEVDEEKKEEIEEWME